MKTLTQRFIIVYFFHLLPRAGMSTASATSLEKKRVRDRRAQTARRLRQDAYIRDLEETARHCREKHTERHVDDANALRATITALQLEIADLRRRQTAAIALLGDAGLGQSSSAVASAASYPETSLQEQPEWSRIPKHSPHTALVETLTPWLLYPSVAFPLEDEPTAHGLLYGSYSNPLANAIHVALICARFGTMAESERLALGWLMYVYTKWVFDPTPARFERLPPFLRPTKLQQDRPHSALIDIIFWPDLRDNFITASLSEDDLLDALRTLQPGLNVSCLSQTPLLEADHTRPGNMVIGQTFFTMFTTLESWTLSDAFIERYPHLVRDTIWDHGLPS